VKEITTLIKSTIFYLPGVSNNSWGREREKNWTQVIDREIARMPGQLGLEICLKLVQTALPTLRVFGTVGVILHYVSVCASVTKLDPTQQSHSWEVHVP
jgi:hypothetical protein